MSKKRLLALVVMFLLVLSIFSIAEETAAETPAQTTNSVSSAEDCGFWCRVNLFGTKNNLRGKI